MNYDVLRMMDNIAVSEIGVNDTLQINLKNRARELQASYLGSEPRIYTYFLNCACEEIGLGKWRSVSEIMRGKSTRFSPELETICSSRLLINNQHYYFICLNKSYQYRYFSSFFGFDKNSVELRHISCVNSSRVTSTLRAYLKLRMYVIESPLELIKWRYIWHGGAIINDILIAQYWPNILKERVALHFKVDASRPWLEHGIEQGLGY